MTTYNAKDLIEQAQMLADLQNSDFISWKENMMFLDNAWSELYQQIINHGDKGFIKTFTFQGESCVLPCDFYQLHYICYSDGINRIPINRKAKTSLTSGPFYDLVGNEIIIYNKIIGQRQIEVEYFPVRDSITFAANDVKVNGIDGTVLDVCDKNVLYVKGSEYFVNDIINGKETPVSRGFILSDSGVINSDKPCFKKDNKVFYTEWTSGKLYVKKTSGTVIHTIDVAQDPVFPTNQVNAMTEDSLLYYKNGNLERFDLETGKVETIKEGLINTRVYCLKGDIYYETADGVFCNDELLVPTLEYSTYHGVMKSDEKTGYGILFDNFVIKSVYGNTELLFPNNVYYNYLAYQLAIYYKIKQGADSSGLLAMATAALKTFYDTLQRDTNENVRIANVYAR